VAVSIASQQNEFSLPFQLLWQCFAPISLLEKTRAFFKFFQISVARDEKALGD
jgi:hypothetical protein